MVGSAAGTAMLIATENIGVRYTGICLLIMVCRNLQQRRFRRSSRLVSLAIGCLLWS